MYSRCVYIRSHRSSAWLQTDASAVNIGHVFTPFSIYRVVYLHHWHSIICRSSNIHNIMTLSAYRHEHESLPNRSRSLCSKPYMSHRYTTIMFYIKYIKSYHGSVKSCLVVGIIADERLGNLLWDVIISTTIRGDENHMKWKLFSSLNVTVLILHIAQRIWHLVATIIFMSSNFLWTLQTLQT